MYSNDSRGLYMVADGVGGMADGEIASATAIAHAQRVPKLHDTATWVRTILKEAQAGVTLKGGRMGTTLTVAAFDREERFVHIGHAGDSRAYRLRKKSMIPLTDDQSKYGMLYGGIFSHKIREEDPPAFYQFAIDRGDTIMLCTDGVHGCAYRGNGLDPEEISSRMSYGNADAMVKAAVRFSDTYDNATAIIVRVR